MDHAKFRGTTVALVTPFTSDGAIDEPRLRALVDWQIERGVDVLLAAGTTGESATLSHEEHHRVMDIVIEQAAGRVPVMCGAGSNATHEAISLTRYAEQAGADAVLSVGPYYNKPTQEGFYQHFKAIAESTSLPVFVYNVPSRTGSNIAAETLLRLAEIPNVAGVKEASGNFGQIMHVLRERPDGFLVLSGDDALTLAILALGGDGLVSVVANEVPARTSRMVRAALEGRWGEARRLHYELLPLMEANFIETNPIPVKAALWMMGRVDLNYRLPLVPPKESTMTRLRTILTDLGLLEAQK